MALKKINHKAAIKTKSSIYEIYLGTFSDNEFTWYSVAKYSDPVKAYKEYKKYVNTQLKYTDEELKKVWDTGRLDVELRQGNKLLNWVGIYSRKVTDLTHEEEKEAQLENKKKSSKQKKDAITPEILIGEVRENLIKYLKSNNIVFDDLKVQARYELDPNQIDFVFYLDADDFTVRSLMDMSESVADTSFIGEEKTDLLESDLDIESLFDDAEDVGAVVVENPFEEIQPALEEPKILSNFLKV